MQGKLEFRSYGLNICYHHPSTVSHKSLSQIVAAFDEVVDCDQKKSFANSNLIIVYKPTLFVYGSDTCACFVIFNVFYLVFSSYFNIYIELVPLYISLIIPCDCCSYIIYHTANAL